MESITVSFILSSIVDPFPYRSEDQTSSPKYDVYISSYCACCRRTAKLAIPSLMSCPSKVATTASLSMPPHPASTDTAKALLTSTAVNFFPLICPPISLPFCRPVHSDHIFFSCQATTRFIIVLFLPCRKIFHTFFTE